MRFKKIISNPWGVRNIIKGVFASIIASMIWDWINSEQAFSTLIYLSNLKIKVFWIIVVLLIFGIVRWAIIKSISRQVYFKNLKWILKNIYTWYLRKKGTKYEAYCPDCEIEMRAEDTYNDEGEGFIICPLCGRKAYISYEDLTRLKELTSR